ncbi:hypothetical protein [Bradyrhizobium vignae]|uniref:hypothetical protein n=1 Tax=Bradyrhizobium vignae TaxID=1549949 RepID=UPI00100BFB9E|nr:hypothetical protein [Bradyrhizobium vignae]RXG88294.1 hypothetical protein EAV90_31155 [Bradyrhizobium vignae]
MTPRARVANLLEGCDNGRKLAESEDLLARLIVEAENDALLLASIELQNNCFPGFTQAEAALIIRKLMRRN